MRLGLVYDHFKNFIKHYEEKRQLDVIYSGMMFIDILGHFIEWNIYRKQKRKKKLILNKIQFSYKKPKQ